MVKISDKMTSGGKALEKMLKELAGMEVRVGFQHGMASEKDGTDICDVAAWNELGTERMPSRPFLRKSVDENKEKIGGFLDETMELVLDGYPVKQALSDIGIFQKDLIQEKITEGDFEPNRESTIRKKGSDKPLIDTGRMRQSVNYVIKKKGSGEP